MASDTDVGQTMSITAIQPADDAPVFDLPQVVAIAVSIDVWPRLEFVQEPYITPNDVEVHYGAIVERCHGPPNLHRLSLSKLHRGNTP